MPIYDMFFSERRKVLKKRFVVIILLMILFIPFIASADELESDMTVLPVYTNKLGVNFSQEDYNLITKIYGDGYIDYMTQEKYQAFKNRNLSMDDIVSYSQTKKYFKTIINNVTNEITTTEVSEQEYTNYNPENASVSSFVETQYKYMQLSLSAYTDGYGDVSLGLIWKMIPATRSFDVLAIRLIAIEVINGSQEGRQAYEINGNGNYIDYAWNGTNINDLDNGFGISMNLINSTDVNYFQMNISAAIRVTNPNAAPTAYGSYQHACSSVTLAQSKNYTLSSAGLGNVIHWPSNIASKYDGMPGLAAYI